MGMNVCAVNMLSLWYWIASSSIGQSTHQHWTIKWYISLGQPGGGGSTYPLWVCRNGIICNRRDETNKVKPIQSNLYNPTHHGQQVEAYTVKPL